MKNERLSTVVEVLHNLEHKIVEQVRVPRKGVLQAILNSLQLSEAEQKDPIQVLSAFIDALNEDKCVLETFYDDIYDVAKNEYAQMDEHEVYDEVERLEEEERRLSNENYKELNNYYERTR